MHIDQIIRQRRSIFPKEFNGKTVDADVIRHLLENANWAPSHKNTYPWKFHVFHGETKDQLFEFWKERQARPEKLEKLTKTAPLVSHVIVIVVDQQGINPEWEEIAATACAVQNMHLTLSVYPQVGGYWGSGNGFDSKEFAHFLGLSDTEQCLGYFMVGMVDEKRTSAERRSAETSVAYH